VEPQKKYTLAKASTMELVLTDLRIVGTESGTRLAMGYSMVALGEMVREFCA
jgi:hypothetical protein